MTESTPPVLSALGIGAGVSAGAVSLAAARAWGVPMGVVVFVGAAVGAYLIGLGVLCGLFALIRRRPAEDDPREQVGGTNYEVAMQIHADRETVWRWLFTPALMQQWDPGRSQVLDRDYEPLQVGMRHEVTVRSGRRETTYSRQITALELLSYIAAESRTRHSGSAPIRNSYRVEDAGDGSTTVTYQVQWDPPEFWPAFRGWLYGGVRRKEALSALARLKACVEAAPGGRGAD